jgi:hypothetical protein
LTLGFLLVEAFGLGACFKQFHYVASRSYALEPGNPAFQSANFLILLMLVAGSLSPRYFHVVYIRYCGVSQVRERDDAKGYSMNRMGPRQKLLILLIA